MCISSQTIVITLDKKYIFYLYHIFSTRLPPVSTRFQIHVSGVFAYSVATNSRNYLFFKWAFTFFLVFGDPGTRYMAVMYEHMIVCVAAKCFYYKHMTSYRLTFAPFCTDMINVFYIRASKKHIVWNHCYTDNHFFMGHELIKLH